MQDFDPQRWTPPPVTPLTGEYAPNTLLDDVELLPVPGHGPEDPLPDGEGGVVVGLDDGRVVRLDLGGGPSRQLAHTAGRPLGLAWLPGGDLLVCDAQRGLLTVPRAGGEVTVLVEAGSGPDQVSLANNAAVADDGTIWFSDSTRRQPLERFTEDLLEHGGTGRLLRRDPDGTLETVLDGFTFTNGVTLTAAQDAVLVASTGDHTLTRVELTGAAAGTHRVLQPALPGFPDNLSTGPSGTIWCAMPAPRNPAVDLLAPRHPSLRRVVANLPQALRPKPERMAFVLGFDQHGQVTHNLQGSGDAYHFITGVHEHDGWLHLGSESHDVHAIARVRVP
jgi:sugar lactone lactonase YvrE